MSAALPAPVAVPDPPDVAQLRALDPLTTTWAAGTPIHRCYDVAWASARSPSAGDAARRGRFHPFTPVGSTADLPVLYGASDADGALSETVFHDLPVRASGKHVPKARLNHRLLVVLEPTRSLLLADLTSHGLSRLSVSRNELIESGPRSYPGTALWARALHAALPQVDGLTWVSRQHDTSRCVVLFADRVAVTDLELPEDDIPLPLGMGRGLDLVAGAANRAGITIIGL